MKPAIESSLLLSLVAGLTYLLAPGIKKWSGYVFLAALTVFVALAMSLTQGSLHEVPTPSFDLDQAELSLKILSAYQATQSKKTTDDLHNAISAVQYQGAPFSRMLVSKVYSQVITSLEKRLPSKDFSHKQIQNDPKELQKLAEIAVVCGDSGDESVRPELFQSTQQLSLSSNPELRDLGEALTCIYLKENVPAGKSGHFETVLKDNLPSGWYKDHALEQLFWISGQSAAYQKLKSSTNASTLAFAQRTVAVLATMTIASFVGIITILGFFATETRKTKTGVVFPAPATVLTHAAAPAPAEAMVTVPWSLTTTYGVFIGWLATQFIVQSIISATAKLQVEHMMHSGLVGAAVMTMVLYIITTLPALLYIWWFACRPFNLNFFDAIRLKLNTSAANFSKLIGLGVLTWCAAIPVVLGSQLLAMRLFSSQGSSNPVLSLVKDAAHSPSILPVTIYFLILGLLAPGAEETLFRGFVYSSLRKKLNRLVACGLSAALFASMHLDPGAFISLFALGFIFALVRERYQSIVPSIVAHGMWNCGTFILVLVLFNGS